jgi:hypothetical protein
LITNQSDPRNADWIYLLQFYETAFGRKLIQSMPAVTQQSVAEGQTWGANRLDQCSQSDFVHASPRQASNSRTFARRIFENR